MATEQERNRWKKRLRRDPEKEKLWRQRLDDQKKSKLSIVGYCRRDNISMASFHWWKKEIRRRDEESKDHVDSHFHKLKETDRVREKKTKYTLSITSDLAEKSLSASKTNIETSKQKNRHVPPVEKSTDIDHAPAFAEIRFTPTKTDKRKPRKDSIAATSSKPSGIDLVLNNGRLLRIRNRSDIDLLLAVIDAMECKTTPC